MNRKRVTVKHKNPNPLFEKWLTEWRDKAQESESKMQYTFNMALKSLRKYPLPLETGKDCKILHGFGEKLCKMLDDKLVQYKSENGDVHVLPPVANVITDDTKAKKPRKRKTKTPENSPKKRHSSSDTEKGQYIPKQGSGAFAILLTLYEQNLEISASSMTKAEIIAKGQHLSNASFTKSGPDTRYTAWSSMKSLLEKKLVNKQGNPPKFSLTQEGTALSDKLYVQHKIEEFQKQEMENEPQPSCSQFKFNDEVSKKITKSTIAKKAPSFSRSATSTSTQSSSTISESVILAPNSFEIVLLVDKQEVSGTKSNPQTEPLLFELNKFNVIHEVRDLKVGDYVWICRDSSNNTELVLPYIIERKRMDDLGSSIKDDRFYEQKFRLKQCGLQNLIYLVENYGKNEHVGLPITTLMQAATNTLIQDGFLVKFTENLKGTCAYLACLSNILTNLFKAKTLVSCSKEDLQNVQLDDDLVSLMHFKEFNKSSIKTRHFKVREMFIKQLLQINGMSVDKALAIVEKYPTPKHLKLAYREINQFEGEKLLSQIQQGRLRKNLGPVLSKIVYQVFCRNLY